jgi:hypothetical protein
MVMVAIGSGIWVAAAWVASPVGWAGPVDRGGVVSGKVGVVERAWLQAARKPMIRALHNTCQGIHREFMVL